MRSLFCLIGIIISVFTNAQIPKLGSDSTLEFATWNVCWLGDSTAGNGPSDEKLQYNNVKYFLTQTDLDLIAIEELSSMSTFYQLKKDLPSYSAVLSDVDQVQKTALFWKNDHFKIIQSHSYSILTDQEYNFGRAPLQVCLELNNIQKDTVYFIVLHMKAYGDQSSYNRRVNASIGLKAYLESSLKNKKYVVIGDWNDDLNYSTYQKSVSPYQNLINSGYHFPSKELTDAGKRSYAYSKVVFDHILHSQYFQDSLYLIGSTSVFDIAPNYILNFSKSTSDHYPVIAKYRWEQSKKINTSVEELAENTHFTIYPNPSIAYTKIAQDNLKIRYQLFNASGILIEEGFSNEIQLHDLASGVYTLFRSGNAPAKLIKISE